MNLSRIAFTSLVVLTLAACGEDEPIAAEEPLQEGLEITLRNTLQDPEKDEATYASLFGQPDAAFDEMGTLSNSDEEFPTALAQGTDNGAPFEISGLYEIDFTETQIDFSVLPKADDSFWSQVFGVFPADKFDRYYFTFSETHNVSGFTSDNENVKVRIDSDKVIVVEISEGYDLRPGVSFTINLK